MSGDVQNQILTAEEESRDRLLAGQNPREPQPRARLALHCWRSGNLEEALVWIDSCLEIDASNVNYYRIRANVLADLNQTIRAVRTALRAVQAAPDSIIARLLTARMLLANLQPAKAQEMLDTTLDMNPEEQHLHMMKSLQAQILQMTRESEHHPLKWYSRKLKKRLANVATEKQRSA